MSGWGGINIAPPEIIKYQNKRKLSSWLWPQLRFDCKETQNIYQYSCRQMSEILLWSVWNTTEDIPSIHPCTAILYALENMITPVNCMRVWVYVWSLAYLSNLDMVIENRFKWAMPWIKIKKKKKKTQECLVHFTTTTTSFQKPEIPYTRNF